MPAPGTSNQFTPKEDQHLVEFLAERCPDGPGRTSRAVYQKLVLNANGFWPWSKSHSAESWRNRYTKQQGWFDYHIKAHLRQGRLKQQPTHKEGELTKDQARQLAVFLAENTTSRTEREGEEIYRRLEMKDSSTSSWSSAHPSAIWRNDYSLRADHYERAIQRYLAKQRLATEDALKSNGAVVSDHGSPPSTVHQSNRLTTHESRRDQSPGADSSKVAPKASKKKASAENLEPSPRKVEYPRSIKKTHQAGPTDPSSDYEELEDAHHRQNQPHFDEVGNHKHDSNASPPLPSNQEKSRSTSQFADSTPLVRGTKTHHRRPSEDFPSPKREALKAATSRLESDIPADSEDIASPHTQFSSKYHNAASRHRPLKRSLKHDEESMPTRNHSSPSKPITTRPNSMQPQKVRKLVHGPFGRAAFETKVPVNDEDSDSSRGPPRPKDLIGLGSDGAHDGLQNGTSERLHNDVGLDGEVTKPHLPLEEGDTLSLTQLENDNQGFGRHGQTAREELDLLLPFIRRQQGNTLPPTFPAPLDPAQHSSEERTSSTTIRKPTLTRGLTPSTLQRTRSTPDLEKKLSRPPERKKSRPSFFGEADRSVQRGSSSTSISINGGRFSSPQTPLSASLPPSPSVIDSDERATLAFQVTQKLFDRFSKEYGWTHSVIEDVFREVNFDPMDARELLDGMHQACLRFKREWDTKRSNAFEDAGGSDFGNNWARRDQ